MEVSKAELCLVQRQEDLDSVAAFEKQNVPGTKGMFVDISNFKITICSLGSFPNSSLV